MLFSFGNLPLTGNYDAILPIEFDPISGITTDGTPTESAPASLPVYGSVGTTPVALRSGFYPVLAGIPTFESGISIRVEPVRSNLDLVGLGLRNHMVAGKMQVSMTLRPSTVEDYGSAYVDNDPTPTDLESAFGNVPIELSAGTFWHQYIARRIVSSPNFRVSLWGVDLVSGSLTARALGISAPSGLTTTPDFVDVTDLVRAYFTYSTNYVGFAWVMLPDFVGDITISDTSLAGTTSAIKAATLTQSLSLYTADGWNIPIGDYSAKGTIWRNPVTLGTGKLYFDGIDLLGTGLMYEAMVTNLS